VADSSAIRPDSSVWFMNSEEGGLPARVQAPTRVPTAAATATPVDHGGSGRPIAPEVSRSQMPTNGAELWKQSLKTGVSTMPKRS
jgi:hypothetical protein